MTGRPGGGPGRPFDPSELDGVARRDEVAGDTEAARVLERFASRASVPPTPDFTDRVMAAVAAEPSPAPGRAAVRAVRHARVGALLLAVRDAWRVLTGPAFPALARAQAAAVVVAVALVAGTAGIGGAAAVGLLGRSGPGPEPTFVPAPTIAPTVVPSPLVAPSPSPSPSPSPTASPTDDHAGSETPDAHEEDRGGSSGGGTRTPSPTSGEDDHHGDRETETPEPNETPKP